MAWPIEPATFQFVAKGHKPPAGCWWLVFLDDSDQADALAYHDLTDEGLPISKVFVKTLLADGALVSVGASHELCEMAVDPWLTAAFQDPYGTFWAGEVCDPVEDDLYGYEIGGIKVSDFVTPTWFGPQHSHPPYDFKGHVNTTFTVLSGGYAQKFDMQGGGWMQINGSRLTGKHQLHAAPGSRRDCRARGKQSWVRSAPR